MPLKHGLLGLLNYGPMTGYELDKTFKDSLNFFWQAQASQIYRELNAMEKLGWLSSEIIFQTDKPNKKLYSITGSGRAELLNWLAQNSLNNEFQVRSEFLMKLFFSGERNVDDNIAMLKDYRTRCAYGLAELEKADVNIEQYSENTNKSGESVYWSLTARFGKAYMNMCLDFADEAIKTLEGLL